MRLRWIAAGAVALAATGIAAGDAMAAGSARITGVGALTETGNAASATAASGAVESRRARVAGVRDRVGAVGEVVVELEARAKGEARPRAVGRVSASDILLLDGRIAIAQLEMSVAAPGDDGRPAEITEASVHDLVVDGEPLEAGPGTRIALEGLGTLVLFEHASDESGSIRANALRVEATEGDGAAAAASPFVIGHLSASAVADGSATSADPALPRTGPGRQGSQRPAPATPSDPVPEPRRAPASAAPTPSPFDVPGLRPAPAPSPAPGGPPSGSSPTPGGPSGGGSRAPGVGGHVFPVLGDVSFTNDYGAPRAVVGWHQGTDLFAETGTPLVAVADGTLFQVGVNRLGGNRLWLRDGSGTEYYYAHLSAFAPGAVNGARVRAGEVIGFVGNSGDAITTPPHLHFEIHPDGGESVNPYPYLVAWQRGGARDVPVAGPSLDREEDGASSEGGGLAPATGAVIVSVDPAREEPAPVAGGRATSAR